MLTFQSKPRSLGVSKPSLNLQIPKNIALNAIVAVSFLVSYSSKALVDDRLAGEGTGKIVGINDPILGWVILGVFTTVWALYTAATKELGGQQEEDGLGL
eukprot:gnl/MRDRNA2_/MRDRNA2_86891_c0_seq1.p1 gnl/MRDRNA2_/MRDRNA2_86891_c0~~gnl/MRDRNA2_/MRDRNA2_86891_c0_seq1.p1  ORF type:complete len:100 (+),score=7.35 gnl/MRDRNA2_/MRDRNA2_86891_c0_seq1:41-340(+)